MHNSHFLCVTLTLHFHSRTSLSIIFRLPTASHSVFNSIRDIKKTLAPQERIDNVWRNSQNWIFFPFQAFLWKIFLGGIDTWYAHNIRCRIFIKSTIYDHGHIGDIDTGSLGLPKKPFPQKNSDCMWLLNIRKPLWAVIGLSAPYPTEFSSYAYVLDSSQWSQL